MANLSPEGPTAGSPSERPAVTTRARLLDRLRASEPWDVLVIGGGATGLGTAVDASARGYRTLLLDAHDFAKGTSSRSTKLVHGGVRYLARGEIGLVREALHERGILQRNAPHLVHARSFLVPAYSWWTRPYYGLGLKVYDALAGRLGLGRSRMIGRKEALRLVPTLEPEHLQGGVLYLDGQFDDSRLAIALLRTVLDLGGTALNGLAVVGFAHEAGRITRVLARDAETGEEFSLPSRAVINASGVFADAIRRMDNPSSKPILRPSQGAHLVLDRAFLPGEAAVMVPRTDDGRVMFAIPWHDRVLIGTTDTPIDTIPIEPRPLAEEVAFLLKHAARYLTNDPRPEDVRSAFAGLRPLIDVRGDSTTTAKLSREHAIVVSESGLLTITGGKWTTYRRMAADVLDRAVELAGLPRKPCVTESLHLHGYVSEPVEGPLAMYGSDAPELQRLIAERPEWAAPLHPSLPYLAGEVVWAARFELARSIEDVLARRTRALFLDARVSWEIAPRVAALLAAELGRDVAWQNSQIRQFQELASGYLLT